MTTNTLLKNQKQLLNKAEDFADEILRHTKHFLPYVARFCLVSTFVEDGLRMWFQWGDQTTYMSSSWGFGHFWGTCFVLINFLGQLIPSGLILAHKFTKPAVGVLFAIVCLQTIAYNIIWDLRFFLRNVAVCGGLCLILAEDHALTERAAARSAVFAGPPRAGGNMPKTYFQLAGRILLALMFATLTNVVTVTMTTPANKSADAVKSAAGSSHIEVLIAALMLCGGTALMVLVVIGYKTRLSALILVAWLSALNLYVNDWWRQARDSYTRDFMKYDFFQTQSVVGGLLMLISLGPGGVSLDEHKKRW